MSITIIILLACIFIELFAGFRRGILRQTLHFVAFAAAAVIAFFTVNQVVSQISGAFNMLDGATMEEMVASLKADPDFGEFITGNVESFLLALDPEIFEYTVVLIIGLVSTFIFMTCFLVFNAIAKIICFIVKFVLPKGHSLATKLPGLALGAIEGALFAVILMLPFANVAGLMRETYDVIAESEAEDADDIIAEYDASTAAFAEDGVLVMIEKVGGRAFYDRFCSLEINGETCNLRTEATSALKILLLDAPELIETDWKLLTEDEKATISSIINTIDDSSYMSTVLSGIMRAASASLESSDLPGEIEPPFDSLISSAISIFGTSTPDNLGEDLATIRDIYFIFSDDGVLVAIENGEDLSDVLTRYDDNGDTTVEKIIDAIKANERAKPLLTELTKISMTIISSELGLGDDATEIYESVKSDINDVLAIDKDDYATTEEYEAAISDQLEIALADNGIELDRGIVDNMSGYIAENYSDTEELTDEEFNDILLSYYDAYLEYKESGTVPAA